MSIRFILGGSGAGKSYTFCKRIIEDARKHPEKQYLVIVPEQFTLQTQLDFVRMHPDHGIFNIDILSFERLAYRVFAETGSDVLTVLRDTGKDLLLRRAAEEISDELTVFGRNFKKPGYVGEMKSLLSEFAQYRIDEEMIESIMALCRNRDLLREKLLDIRKLMARFYELLGKDFITGEQLLERLSRLLPKSRIAENAVIGFDGFTGFTPIQTEVVEILLKQAQTVYLTLDTDEEDPLLCDEQSLFFLQDICMRDVTQLASKNHVLIEDPIREVRPYPRFQKEGALSHLEENLFRRTGNIYSEEPSEISIHEKKNPEEEVRFAAEEITRLIRNGARYRDIAVITAGAGDYNSYIPMLFDQGKIPYFIDVKHDILQNAFIEYIRSAISLAEERYSYESVMRYLKCGMSGWDEQDVFLLENYILALGIRGFKQWNESWVRRPERMSDEDFMHVRTLREKFLDEVGPFVDAIRKRGRSVESVTRELYRLLTEQGMQERLQEKEKQCEEMGLLSLAKEFGQIYKVVMDLFDQFVLLLGAEQVTVTEYRELLEAGLSEARVGIVPPGRDQVTVGDLERTRLAQVKYVFFLGLNDAYLPGAPSRGGILTDSERRFLASCDVKLAPDAAEKIGIQRFYLYFALTRPSKHIYLTYCNADMDGKPMRPSCYLRDITGLFSNLFVTRDEKDAAIDPLLSEENALRYLADGLMKDPLADSMWTKLYGYFSKKPEREELLENMLLSRYGGTQKKLDQKSTDDLYGHELRVSASSLELYAACPYAFFSRYGLKLFERQVYEFRAVDEGTILHDALHRFVSRLMESHISWRSLTDADEERLCKEVMHEAAVDYGSSVLASTARLRYTRKRLERLFQRTIWALGRQFRAGDFEIEGTELSFGKGKRDRILLPAGKLGTISLSGKIDRLDIAREEQVSYLKILDYKTGSKNSNQLARIWYGLDQQLLLYLGLAEKKEKERDASRIVLPAGMFYYRVKDPFLSRKDVKNDLQEEILSALRPDGFFNGTDQVLAHFDTDFASSDMKRSMVIRAEKKKDGTLSGTSASLTAEEFKILQERLFGQIQNFGKEILSGRMETSPCRLGTMSPCVYCTYRTICGFSVKKPGCRERVLDALKDEDIMKKLHGEDA